MSNSKHKTPAEQDRSGGALYGIAIAAALVAAVALFIWNSGIFQSKAPAAIVNGQEYSVAEVNYYYSNVQQYQYYLSVMGMSPYDPTKSAKEQVYDEEAGTTWHDFMLEQALETLRQDAALADLAEKDGFTLSDEGKASVENNLSSLDASWISSGYPDLKSYLIAVYGEGMDKALLSKCMNRAALANEYYADQTPEFTYEQTELDAYYAEHKDELETFVVSQFLFQATVPTTDADGNEVEMTDEEKAAALETAKAEAKAKAEALQARLAAGEDAAALLVEFEEDLGYSYANSIRLANTLNSNYAEWAAKAQVGDTTLVDYAGSSDAVHVYCVARIEDRYQDNSATANVHSIMVSAGSAPSDADYTTALTKADELLAKFQAGEKTAVAFAALVGEDNEDTSILSATKSNINNYSGQSQDIVAWSLDAARTPGESGIVKDDESYTKGYQVLFFEDADQPYWVQIAESTMAQEDLTQWQEDFLADYTLENGDGLKNVG